MNRATGAVAMAFINCPWQQSLVWPGGTVLSLFLWISGALSAGFPSAEAEGGSPGCRAERLRQARAAELIGCRIEEVLCSAALAVGSLKWQLVKRGARS